MRLEFLSAGMNGAGGEGAGQKLREPEPPISLESQKASGGLAVGRPWRGRKAFCRGGVLGFLEPQPLLAGWQNS